MAFPSGSSYPSYQDLIARYYAEFHAAAAAGKYQPYVLPYRAFGVYAVIAYMLLPPTSSRLLYCARYPVFAFCLYWCHRAVVETRSPVVTTAYGIGLLNAWTCLWLSTLVIWRDARSEAKRVESTDGRGEGGEVQGTGEIGALWHSTAVSRGNGGGSRGRYFDKQTKEEDGSLHPLMYADACKYRWQALPPDFLHRLHWISDLICSPRAPGWTHQISALPPSPAPILFSLNNAAPSPPRRDTSSVRSFASLSALVKHDLVLLLVSYVALDGLKMLMMADPYFLGFTGAPAPAHLPPLIAHSPVLTRSYRLLASLFGFYFTLQLIFVLCPLVLAGALGPRFLGVRAEPWLYSDFFGNYAVVGDKGLRGWWGLWWHQMFRCAFQAPVEGICRAMDWKQRSKRVQILGTLMAFGLSACLHACGSLTMWPETRPWGPFAFFALQPVGILGETAVLAGARRFGTADRLPGWARKLLAFAWVHVWFYCTAPLFTDDVARGGIWLHEPVPVSLLRGLGFGGEKEVWWRWGQKVMWWHKGERWWLSGLAF